MSDALPTLWQIDVSPYSEKARWALAWKVRCPRVNGLPVRLLLI